MSKWFEYTLTSNFAIHSFKRVWNTSIWYSILIYSFLIGDIYQVFDWGVKSDVAFSFHPAEFPIYQCNDCNFTKNPQFWLYPMRSMGKVL